MTRVLEGIRVIDFGQYIAGPLAAMLLADQGADVIRVDPPSGPRFDTTANATWNRGKRSIALDLKREDDSAIAKQLLASADVVIENFRPRVMERLGLGKDAMTRANPRLIYCSLPGFAEDDPRAAMPAWEGVIGAATATYMVKAQALKSDGGRRTSLDESGRPIYTIIPVSSAYAAFFAATSIAMALIARQRDGLGQTIEVPLFDATFAAIGSPHWVGIPGSPWVRQYECADGRWIVMTGYHKAFNTAFLHAAGVEHWADEWFAGNLAKPFRTDPQQAQELIRRMEALFRTRSAQEWEDALNAAGVPTAICRSSDEWLEAPHAHESKAIIEVNDHTYGHMLQPGVQIRMSETPGAVSACAPRLDQHREEILADLKNRMLSAPLAVQSLPDGRPPLSGIRVIDLGTVLVGPACGRSLAEFGAEVIKIDDPRGFGPGVDVSRGKRSMLLDLKQPAGQEVLAKLIDSADVFVQNFRLGVAERLGFGYEQLRARRPDLVYVSFTLHGREGPWAGRPGYEYQAQGATGMQARFGGGPPAIESFPVSDYGTAIMGAYAVGLALYHRAHLQSRGEKPIGQHVDTALVYTTSLLQSQVLQKYAGKVWDEPRGQNVLGTGALHRNYQARDGWLFLAARTADVRKLDAVQGLSGLALLPSERRAKFLEERFATDDVATWVQRITEINVAAHRTMTVAEVMRDPWVHQKGLHLVREHPDGGTVATIGPIPRFARTPLQPGRPLRPTMDARDILRDVQLESELERLINEGVVVIRPPRKR